jgi:ribose transport system substrate-binding protein
MRIFKSANPLQRGRLRPKLLIALFVAAAAIVAGGCGSSSSSSSSSHSGSKASSAEVAAAQKTVKEAEQAAVWNGPSTPVDVSSLKGKDVWVVTVGNSIPIVAYYLENLEAAFGEAGIHMTVFDGKLQTAEFLRGTSEAVAQKADAILLVAIPAQAVAAPLSAAKAAGIPVVVTDDVDAGEPLPPNVNGAVRLCFTCVGKDLGAWVTADSNGEADTLAYSVSNSTNAPFLLKGFESQMAASCPECKLTTVDAPDGQWQNLPGQTRTAMQRDPNINYIVPMYDGMAATILPTVAELGRTEDVQLGSFNGTQSVMKQLSPAGGVGADIASANAWYNWAMADQTMRAMVGAKPISNYNIPLRLFTRTNVGEIDVNSNPASWFGTVDFEAKFKALWGLG